MASTDATDRGPEGGLVEYCEVMWPRLVGGVALHCRDRLVAEEIAQETLVRLWQRWDRISTGPSIDGWVWTVALNLARSTLRRRAAERRARARLENERAVEAVDSAEAIAVREAVLALPERQRTAVVLRFFADLSVADVAAAMGCAEGTVSAHTHKASQALRSRLGEAVPEGGRDDG